MNLTILIGDAKAELGKLESESVQCCVTSPPYWGLRDYGVAGQIGMETTPQDYVRVMVEVFEEVRRVLRPDGTCWVNLGDSYAANRSYQVTDNKHKDVGNNMAMRVPAGLKPKDLVGIPWRVAFALQEAGWYLRSDIIWHKPNPMPESVTDRPTKAHEYLFLLTKSERYFYDQEAILDPVSDNTHARLSQNVQAQIGSARANGGGKANGNMKAVGRKFDPSAGNKNNPSFDAAMAIMPDKRNKRSVWTVPTQSYSGAHFATFPPDLIKPCILAGSRPGDVVLDPFGGSGTTGQVAIELGRRPILIELNPEYAKLIEKRCRITPGFL